MKTVAELKENLTSGAFRDTLSWLYCCNPEDTSAFSGRYLDVLAGLENTYGAHAGAALFSAPGRTEIGGNHTDHQHGCVLAGSVNIDMIAAVAANVPHGTFLKNIPNLRGKCTDRAILRAMMPVV